MKPGPTKTPAIRSAECASFLRGYMLHEEGGATKAFAVDRWE
jgi:hypothetical protein